jgi:hypothetical protein
LTDMDKDNAIHCMSQSCSNILGIPSAIQNKEQNSVEGAKLKLTQIIKESALCDNEFELPKGCNLPLDTSFVLKDTFYVREYPE